MDQASFIKGKQDHHLHGEGDGLIWIWKTQSCGELEIKPEETEGGGHCWRGWSDLCKWKKWCWEETKPKRRIGAIEEDLEPEGEELEFHIMHMWVRFQEE